MKTYRDLCRRLIILLLHLHNVNPVPLVAGDLLPSACNHLLPISEHLTTLPHTAVAVIMLHLYIKAGAAIAITRVSETNNVVVCWERRELNGTQSQTNEGKDNLEKRDTEGRMEIWKC